MDILISHDKRDEPIASALKIFLENIFLGSEVFVAGRDLQGGQTWIQEIKSSLKTCHAIITLLTKDSLQSNWVYFESGVGFTDDKTIPVTIDLKKDSLQPPLSLLQARAFTKDGIILLTKDISKKLSQRREPKTHPGIDDLLDEVNKFIQLRKVMNLEKLIPKKFSLIKERWTHKNYCLVHDFKFKDAYEISVDANCNASEFQIELFARNADSTGYLFNELSKVNLLPKPFDSYDTTRGGSRILFKKFDFDAEIQDVADSLLELLERIEQCKERVKNSEDTKSFDPADAGPHYR